MLGSVKLRGISGPAEQLFASDQGSSLSLSLSLVSYLVIIFKLFFYGCKTWSLTLREEHRLRMFESRVLRKIFGPKRDEVTLEWRKLRNEELNDL